MLDKCVFNMTILKLKHVYLKICIRQGKCRVFNLLSTIICHDNLKIISSRIENTYTY